MDTTTAAANYPQNLGALMDQGNPFLQNMAIAQQQTGQAQAGQNLNATLQATKQQAQMFPLLQGETVARTKGLTAQGNLAQSEANKNADALKILQSVPDDTRAHALLQQTLATTSEANKKILADKMTMLQPYALDAAANKGTLTLPMQEQLKRENPELIPYFKDAGTGLKTASMAKAWLQATPDFQQATAVAGIHAGATIATGREHNKTLENINAANISAGKYANHSLDYVMAKAAASGNYQVQSGAWTQRAQLAREAAQNAVDQDQQTFFLQKAAGFEKLANDAKSAGLSQAAAAAYTALAGKVDPASFQLPSANPGGKPSPEAPSPAPVAPATNAGSQPLFATDGKSRITSTDGGKTWHPVK